MVGMMRFLVMTVVMRRGRRIMFVIALFLI